MAARELVEVPDAGWSPGAFTPAPRAIWADFPTWDAFAKRCSKRSRNAFNRSAKKLAKLGAEVGPVRFSLDEPDHRLLEDLLLWKSRQLRRTARVDRYASPRNRQFLHLLLDEGQLKLSALFAGDHAVAMECGARHGSFYSSWIAGYDAAFAARSPGILLFEHAMRTCREEGLAGFDFLAGGETYKLNYATHAWLVGAVGTPTAPRAAVARLRSWVTDHKDDAELRVRAYQAGRRVLDQRLARERLADLRPIAPWNPIITENQANWPHGRLQHAERCQRQVLLDWGAKGTPAVAVRLQRTSGTVRRRGTELVTSLRDLAHAPVGEKKPLNLEPGAYVRVRTRDEIEPALVDGRSNGVRYDAGVMAPLGGCVLRVVRAVERFHDTAAGRVVYAPRTVLLDGACCDGRHGGDGCDLACALLWSEDWLEPVDAPLVEPAAAPPLATPPFQPGDAVRVRPMEDIERLGDGGGVCFVSEVMSVLAGRVFRVASRPRKAWDHARRAAVPLDGCLLLDGARCPGAPLVGGGVCDRGCALLWREEWLEGSR